jgi:hypothetical protein
MYCTDCGALAQGNFCTSCGSQITDPKRSQTPLPDSGSSRDEATKREGAQEAVAAAPANHHKPIKGKRKFWLAGAGIGVVILVAGASALVVQGPSASSPSSNAPTPGYQTIERKWNTELTEEAKRNICDGWKGGSRTMITAFASNGGIPESDVRDFFDDACR